jgi:hypothetical protein
MDAYARAKTEVIENIIAAAQSRGEMSLPALHLRTYFVLDDDGRIISTREPSASRGPLFTLVKGGEACAWPVRADVPPAVGRE